MRKCHGAAAALLILLASAAPLAAQTILGSAAADARVNVTVASSEVVALQDLDFGTQFSGSVVRSSDVPTQAQWNLTFNSDGPVMWEFTLPTHLTGPNGSVGISFGNTSLRIDGYPEGLDPATPYGLEAVTGMALQFHLGEDMLNDGTGDVMVNLVGAPTGLYEGSIMLTVRVP